MKAEGTNRGPSMKTIVAIDPGFSGGIAVAQFGKTDCSAMPDTEGDLLALLRGIKTAADLEGDATVCVLEEVNGYAGRAQPGSAMFRFGEHFGFTKGVVQTLDMKLELVRPQKWQKGFSLGTASGCASKTEWKNKLKAEAQRRFPHLAVTLKTADALLILDWARRTAAAESPLTLPLSPAGGEGHNFLRRVAEGDPRDAGATDTKQQLSSVLST
jgi:hypothetical protein